MGKIYTIRVVIVATLVLSTSSILSHTQPAIAADEGIPSLTQTELLIKGNPKLDSTLNQLASVGMAASPTPLVARSAPQLVDNTVRVIVEAVPGQAENIANAVGDSGNIEASYGDLLQAVVPISQLNALAEMTNVRFIRMPSKPLPAVVTSEGVAVINADEWLDASYNGTGVKIGILDVGFSGYTERQAEGELPSSINT